MRILGIDPGYAIVGIWRGGLRAESVYHFAVRRDYHALTYRFWKTDWKKFIRI